MEKMVVKDILGQAQFRPEKMGKADLVRGEMLLAGLNCFEPGQEHSAHVHVGQDKLYCVLQGEGELMIGAVTTSFREGDLALAPAGVEHALRNTGPGRLVVMVVFSPPPAHK